jgi:fatty-acyl-CoA synthase
MHMTEVTIAYGMTETSPVSFQSATDDPLDKRVSTVGRILPHLEVKIVDVDGRTVPVGEKGELCTRGYSVMQGYWDDPERTAEADARRLDAHRRPGHARRAGLLQHRRPREGHGDPRRRERLPARGRGVPLPPPQGGAVQVFGVPDPRYGEELCAWIVLTKRGRDYKVHRGRDPRVLPRPDRALQGAALRRRFVAAGAGSCRWPP